MKHGSKVHAAQFLRFKAAHPAQGLIDVNELSLPADNGHADRSLGERGAKTTLAFR
jgi:hypothetical protein